MIPPFDFIGRRAKARLVGEVRSLFNDEAKGEKPVIRSDNGLFGPQSVAWRVNGDVTSMMVGGVTALLLQMLHPAVLAGVWDHSNFRTDMLGRLRRTARFIAVTGYADREEALAAIAQVRAVHDRIGGTLPDGTPYQANDPELLAWVHVSEAVSFLDAWIRYAEPHMLLSEQDRYFDEMAMIGEMLGAVAVPRSHAEAMALIETMRPSLTVTERTREVAHLVLNQPSRSAASAPLQAMVFQAAVDLLPRWAREMHGLHGPVLTRPLIRAGTYGVAKTLRWAFS
jgi:uncharacterized protein (DUF2236 family)